MYLIVGLGNPENEYAHTRHNMGFDTINQIAKNNNIQITKNKFKGLCESTIIQNQKVILLKPQTYMNLSGESVRAVIDFYELNPESDIIVISDDISLPTGKIRIRAKGSAGGHNGLKSIIAHAGTDKFKRIKVGVGANEGDLVKHVLGKFSKQDRVVVDEAIRNAASAAEVMVICGVEEAMNKFN